MAGFYKTHQILNQPMIQVIDKVIVIVWECVTRLKQSLALTLAFTDCHH